VPKVGVLGAFST